MPTTDTPLRYPGGKTQLAPFVTELMRANGLMQSVYCEPFAGGAGIACRLLLNGTASEVWINDIDPAIHAFWYSVLNSTDELCDRITRASVNIPEWHRQRDVQSDGMASTLDLGFSTLFLNRTNRSGILRGGVIGGKEQAGAYSLDCRFDRADLVRKIKRIALYREQIRLSCTDARLYIGSTLKKLPAHALVNVDPPYYRAGPDLYTNSYQHKDHAALARTVRAMPHRWMLTYDDAAEIRAMYLGLPHYRKTLTYYAQVKRSAAELLVLSSGLTPPPSLVVAELGAEQMPEQEKRLGA
jgi:DNA adenine methylase